MRKSYYETVEDDEELNCAICQAKYKNFDQKMAPCQLAEILPLSSHPSGKAGVVSLSSNVSQLWLLEPFIGQVEAGQVIAFTGFYFMCPN